ncbi:MAG: ATP-dependent RNA helicase RhlB [Gammaproteobacteria bacterium]|nr:ATP-dependent RNA helicase RhlB [Gammaproteobacteria bacterium]
MIAMLRFTPVTFLVCSPPMTENYLTNQHFTGFALDPAVLRGIEDAGFEHCTPIQAETLPHLLRGEDVAGQAQTGTGKTAAYLVALFQHLLTHSAPPGRTDSQPRALVLAPTRELAIQIYKDAQLIGKFLDMRFRLVYGGTGYESQRRDLRQGVEVLIGTPGRIIDYLKQGIYPLDGLQVVVLDEADRMFDLGFIKDIRYLFRKMPKATERLNMLFSATLSFRVNELAYEHMNNPRMVKIESDKVTVDQVTQRVYFPSNEDKLSLLMGLIRDAGDTRTLVFINTKYQSEYVATKLKNSGFKAGVLSGDVPQKMRESLLNRFTSGEVKVLVATDVAARGLHIPDVSQVVNYDLPQDPGDYVHRIGRTARAGAAGDAISFACETYAFSLPEIEAFIAHKIEPATYSKKMLVQPGTDGSVKTRPKTRGERKDAGNKDKMEQSADDRRALQKGRKPKGEQSGARSRSQPATQELPRDVSAPGPKPGDKARLDSDSSTQQRKSSGHRSHEIPAVG